MAPKTRKRKRSSSRSRSRSRSPRSGSRKGPLRCSFNENRPCSAESARAKEPRFYSKGELQERAKSCGLDLNTIGDDGRVRRKTLDELCSEVSSVAPEGFDGGPSIAALKKYLSPGKGGMSGLPRAGPLVLAADQQGFIDDTNNQQQNAEACMTQYSRNTVTKAAAGADVNIFQPDSGKLRGKYAVCKDLAFKAKADDAAQGAWNALCSSLSSASQIVDSGNVVAAKRRAVGEALSDSIEARWEAVLKLSPGQQPGSLFDSNLPTKIKGVIGLLDKGQLQSKLLSELLKKTIPSVKLAEGGCAADRLADVSKWVFAANSLLNANPSASGVPDADKAGLRDTYVELRDALAPFVGLPIAPSVDGTVNNLNAAITALGGTVAGSSSGGGSSAGSAVSSLG